MQQAKQIEQFYLKLSDGSKWGFNSAPELKEWFSIFARIMSLKKDNSDVDYLFNIRPKNGREIPAGVDESWDSFRQSGAYTIWSKKGEKQFLIEINKEFIDHPEIRVINMWSTLKALYKFYAENGGGPVHSGMAALNGKAILIAAPGGTGKSTSIRRLPDYWKKMCDDTTLIVKKDDNFFVHPMPTWSDHLWEHNFTTFDTSRGFPLAAVFFLKQSGTDKVTPISRPEGIQLLLSSVKQVFQTYVDKLKDNEKSEMTMKLFDNTCNIVGKTPCYRLEATLNGDFWEEIEKVL